MKLSHDHVQAPIILACNLNFNGNIFLVCKIEEDLTWEIYSLHAKLKKILLA
jgi:hypothetical protein